MKFDFVFRQVDVSQSLKNYTQDQFERIAERLLKDSHWSISYTMGKHDYTVEVSVRHPEAHFKANGNADSFYEAVDIVTDKLEKQFMKRRQKVQHHKKFQRSKQAKLERLNEQLEYNDSPDHWVRRPA